MIEPIPSDQFHQGDILNHTYEIEGVLGRGGTGEVYRGRNQVTGRVVAIKVLSAQFSENADFVALMRREDMMRGIQHDAVVRYIDCARAEGGQVYLVMEYIEGRSLGDVMERDRLDPRELMIVAHRVAEGLAATHGGGIVHRDLSPDNVILRDGRPEAATIIDFGIAKDTAAGAQTVIGDGFAGKYEYAAPEQFDGKAESRSDLYALGATLLAAWRGETPYAGATPGEIVRRKQLPLDLSGVPEPLAGLVATLAAPDPARRPRDAAAALELIEAGLGRGRQAKAGERPARRRGLLVPGLAAVVLVAAVAAWVGGAFDALFEPPLPRASPYRLTASAGPEGAGMLVANAPDEATGRALADAYAAAAGAAPERSEVALATGQPTEDWAARAQEVLGVLGGLEAWAVTIEDLSLQVRGVASDADAAADVEERIAALAEGAGMAASVEIGAGPLRLPAGEVEAALDEMRMCGPLSQVPPESGVYGIDDTVVVTGAVPNGTDTEAVRRRLNATVGDRPLRLELTTLDPAICSVRQVLPPVGSGPVSIWLGDGETGASNLGGIFRTGQNPVAEVRMPADVTDGYLWVMVVDNSGVAFNLVPSEARPDNRIGALGQVEAGVRQIRILWSASEVSADPTRIGFTVDDANYGRSEVLAIVTRTPLFPSRRPLSESVESLAENLADAFETHEGEIVAIASRLIDARP